MAVLHLNVTANHSNIYTLTNQSPWLLMINRTVRPG